MSDSFPIAVMDKGSKEVEEARGLRVSSIVNSHKPVVGLGADDESHDAKKNHHDIIVAEIKNMDQDGNGRIEGDELYRGIAAACDRAVKAERKASNFKMLAIGLATFALLLAGANFATSFLAYKLGKDTKLENGSLTNMDGDAVSVNQNMVSIPLAAIAWMDAEVIQKIETVAFNVQNSNDETESMFLKVASVRVVEKTSFIITTITNDKIVWSVDEDAVLTTADGETFENENFSCASCSSVSVVETDALKDRMEEFESSYGVQPTNGRALFMCPPGRSRKNLKRDIRYLDPVARDEIGKMLLDIPLAQWNYKNDPASTPQRLGFMIDDIEPSFAVEDKVGDSVNLYGFISMATAAIQMQQDQIEKLQKQIDARVFKDVV